MDLIIGSAKGKERKVNPEARPKACFRVVLEKRSDRLAVLKTAIREGAYKVKAGDIAE